jgi:hypothetical protein
MATVGGVAYGQDPTILPMLVGTVLLIVCRNSATSVETTDKVMWKENTRVK